MRQPEQLLERRQPEQLLERRQPEHLLESWQRRQSEHLLDRRQTRQPECPLERWQRGYFLDKKPRKCSPKPQLHACVQQWLKILVWENQLKRVHQKRHVGHVQDSSGNRLQKHLLGHQRKFSGGGYRMSDPSVHKLELAEDEQQHQEIIKTPLLGASLGSQQMGHLYSRWWMTKLQGLLEILMVLTISIGENKMSYSTPTGCSSKELSRTCRQQEQNCGTQGLALRGRRLRRG